MASASQLLSGVQGGIPSDLAGKSCNDVEYLVPWDCHANKSFAVVPMATSGTFVAGKIVDITGALRVDLAGYYGGSTSHGKGVYVDALTGTNSQKVYSVTDVSGAGCLVRYIPYASANYSDFLESITMADTYALYAGDSQASQLLTAFYGLIRGAIEGIKPGCSAYPGMIMPAFTDHRLGMGV